MCVFFFFQAEDGIRYVAVTGVQTCALPISHRPEEPVRSGVKKQAELVGRGLMAGGAVGGEMVLPRLDVVLRLTARAVEPLIERLGAAVLEVGDDKAGIASLGPGLDP